jgi:hypothetical protein
VPNSTEDVNLMARLERIQKLTEQLAKVREDAVKPQPLSQQIHREIEAAKIALKVHA